jgi:5-methylcytosine-specific restriction endonuclease McrA
LCRPCRVWATRQRYRETDKYRGKEARYQQSEKGRAANARRRQTDKYRAKEARYHQSEKGRAANARQRETDKYRAKQARYDQSKTGRAQRAVYRQSAKRRAVLARYNQSKKARATQARRRALRRARERNAIVVERVDRRSIFALDGGVCHLCDLPVDPEAFHVDHVIPLSVEPIHAEFNCAVTHPTCNVRKWKRLTVLSTTARARWYERRPEHLALLDQHLARLAA